MINNYKEYEGFLRQILKRINLLKKEQLIISLIKKYGNDMNYELAKTIITSLQNDGYLLCSNDGWVMTKGVYVSLTNDKFYDDIDFRSENYINKDMEDLCKEYNPEVVKCMWLVAAMMPDSEEFCVGTMPWYTMFISREKENATSKLYQITYISKENVRLNAEVLKYDAMIKNPGDWKSLRRIAIIDDAEYEPLIPRVGFTHIAVLDEQSPLHYRVIKKREGEEVWG